MPNPPSPIVHSEPKISPMAAAMTGRREDHEETPAAAGLAGVIDMVSTLGEELSDLDIKLAKTNEAIKKLDTARREMIVQLRRIEDCIGLGGVGSPRP